LGTIILGLNIKMITKDLETDMKSLGKEMFEQNGGEFDYSRKNRFLSQISELEKIKVRRFPVKDEYDEGINLALNHLGKLINHIAESGINLNSKKESSDFYYNLRNRIEDILSQDKYKIVPGKIIHGYQDGIDFYLERLEKQLL